MLLDVTCAFVLVTDATLFYMQFCHSHVIAGHYCPVRSPAPVVCDPGYYQDQPQQATCTECPAGYYCDTAAAPVSDYTLTPCPAGIEFVN